MMILTMPVYFTLQEALSASQTASKDYNLRMTGGREGKAIFSQKPEIKPVIDLEPVGVAPITQKEEPKEDPTKDLQEKINKVLAERTEVDKKLKEPEPAKEIYKEPPSLIVGASFVLIDPIRADAQDVHGAQAVQNRYAQQNDEAWIVKPFARGSRNAKKAGSKVAWTTGKIIASSVRHPVATAQNMVRDPFENRDIHFAYAVNEMVKKKLFPNNPELALLVPDSFIDNLLVKGREKRNKQGTLKKNWNAIKDFMPAVTTGFVYDTQQKRALEYLSETIDTDPDGLLKKIEESTLDSGTKLAKRFSTTLVVGDELLPDQKKIGDSHVLLPEEKRSILEVVDEVTKQDKVETQIKEKIKPFVDRNTEMTLDEKKQLVKEVTQIYIDNAPKDKLNKNGKPKGEAVVDVLDLIAELKKDPDNREYYQKHWPELKIISYIGESKGDTLGGQERFLTWNQKLAIKCAKNGAKLNGGWTRSAVMATAKIGVYTSGFALSYGLGVAKLAPRTGVNGILLSVSPFFGPAVAGSVAGLTETQSVHLGKFYQRRSRIDNDLARTSRGKALGEKPGELDAVRGNLEDATVETVPAEALTTEINKLILVDPNNFGSETRTPVNKEEVLQLLAHMAHARARLEQTMMSGSKELGYKTSNWVSYHAGREQEELTNLTGASCQSFARLLRLQVENPALFDGLPFLPTPDGDLNEALKSMTAVIKAGLMEGLPSELIDGSPLSTFKGQKFYKQIFNASGIPETETDQVFNFINSLKTTSKVGIKTVGEWMDEAESFRSRMKALEKIRNSRFRFAAATGAITSEIIGGAKHAVQPGIDYVEAQIAEHIVQPVIEHIIPNHPPVTNNPSTGSGQAPDQLPNQPLVTNNETLTIDLPNIFKEPTNGVAQIYKIFDEGSGKTAEVRIPLADGYKFDIDKDQNIDVIKISDGSTAIDDVFVFDQTHQALIPNSNFIPDAAHPDVTVNLEEHINFVTNQKDVPVQGTPVELSSGAAIVGYLKEHYREAMTTIAHRDVMKEQQALTTFIDSEGKVHITQGGYTAPNAFTGQLDDLTAGLESGNGALWFTFGKNADGSATPGTPLSFEGIKVPLEWNGHHGEFVFDPRHPTTPQEILLAKLIDQNALNEFKTNEPNQWLNESDLGKLWMGIRGYEGGYESNTPDGVKMHNFEMEFAGENNKLVITPPESTIPIETTSLIPPNPVEVKIPGDPIPPVAVPPIQPVQPTPTDSTFSPFPGPYYSPQLHPTEVERNIPASSTPLPQSIINSQEFKKERQPSGYDNARAFNFLSGLPDDRTIGGRIDEFVYDHVFNQTQNKFMQLPTTADFINHDISQEIRSHHSTIYEKMSDNEQLTSIERDELKTAILTEGKNKGLTDQEALIIHTFIVHRAYLRSLNSTIQEKKQLDEELRNLNESLEAVRVANATPINIPPQNSPKHGEPIESQAMKKSVDQFTSKIIRDYPNLSAPSELTQDELIELNDQIESDLEEFITHNFLTEKQNNILQEMKELKRTTLSLDEIQKTNENIFNKLMSSEPLSSVDKKKLKPILEQKLHTEEAETFYIVLTNINAIASQIREKMKAKEADDEQPEIEIVNQEEDGKIPPWLIDETDNGWHPAEPEPDPDHAVANIRIDQDALAKNKLKIGEFEGKEVFKIYEGLLKEGANVDTLLKSTIEGALHLFEINNIPVILGGTYESIVVNPNDEEVAVQNYFLNVFKVACRNYMMDYASRGRDADNAEIRMAFNKLKSDLGNIDPSVNLVGFEQFMDGIRSAV